MAEYVDGLLEVFQPHERLEMISFTDHNRISIDVYMEFMGRNSGIVLLPGIEVDVLLEEGGDDKHLVVYFDCIGDEQRLGALAVDVNKIMSDNNVSDENPILIGVLLDKLLEVGVRFAISPHAFKQKRRGIDYDMHPLDPDDRHIDKYIDQFFCFWETSGISQSAYAIQFLKEMDRGDRESIVAFSDSKDFIKLGKYLEKPHQYFDSLATFDGVQMVGTEVSRISSEPTDVPRSDLGKYIGWIDAADIRICLSPRLNAIIGGRDSGKSALLDRLAISIMGEDAKTSFDEERLEFLSCVGYHVTSLAGSDVAGGSFGIEFFNQSYISGLFAKTGKPFNDELRKYFSSAFSKIPEVETQAIRAENIQRFYDLLEESSSQKPENIVDFAGEYLFNKDEELAIDIKKGDKPKVDASLRDFSYSDTLKKVSEGVVKTLPKFLKADHDIVEALEEFKAKIAEIAYQKRLGYLEGDYLTSLLVQWRGRSCEKEADEVWRITANRKSIDKEKIAVEGPAPEFDAQSFKEVITEVVTEYLNAISIEEQCYLKAIGKAEALLDDETEEGIEAEA